MEQMSDKFRWEVKEVKRIRNAVRRRQSRIAQANLRACCAIMIQATWRRYQAKLLAWARRGLKLGQILMRWWRRAYKSMWDSRHLPGRADKTTTLNPLVPGTYFSTGQNFKVRQSLKIVKRFVSNNVQRHRRLKYEKQISSTRVQRAWRRWMLRMSLSRMVLATAATEEVIENVLMELARQVYVEIKGAVIARAWKQSRRRFGSKSRKGKNGRVFVTQGGGSSPRRKPARVGGSRTGVTSDPSSAYPPRRSPSAAPGNRGGNRGKNGPAVASPPPAFLGVVAAATTSTATSAGAAAVAAGGAGGDTNEERRGSSQSSNPLPSSRQKTVSPSEDGSSALYPHPRSRRARSSASATTEEEALRDGGAGGSKVPDSSSANRPPFEAVPGVESPKSEMSCSSSYGVGDGGRDVFGRVEDDATTGAVEGSVVDGGTTLNEEAQEQANATSTVAAAAVAVASSSGKVVKQPMRPSGEKPSKLSEGRRSYSRPHAIQVGGRSRLHSSGADGGSRTAAATKEVVASALAGSSAESNNGDPLAAGEATTAAGCVTVASGATGAEDTEALPAAGGLGKREVNFEETVRLGGDDDGDDGDGDRDNDDDDDDDGDANKIPAAVGPDEIDAGSKKSKLEEYGSDVFESDGELSLTR
ncbi:hypothetical protein Esi_0003_0167 [Ectocarpus siliculosus]|uniref:Uncharacterized protein n=1 Tax=Ectocarpus siliculosus TaxID=2880 RepID=D7FW11_ECTSI|nr:hypothetical protein Esi_0003_0167 [Ectocarpus siliculosus]|eukprot:CBJ25531.1 hypothetical protein Esi_0003_0167 [Ectocarpus siliculosus]